MPLIRYRLDDTATPYYDLFKIEGHRDGVLYGNDGEIISAAIITNLFRNIKEQSK